MIRLEQTDHWLLLSHPDHAALAGDFARHWKNADFEPPQPFARILDAVTRHDDSWKDRDAAPELTPDGLPSAFSHELVGTYDAFEEIDLEAYLGVRGQATEQAAQRDPYAAVLISMHTENLLTEQADPTGLTDGDRALLDQFVSEQRARQRALIDLLKAHEDLHPFLTPEAFRRGFEFLQACDSFSLLVGVDYPSTSQLRHPQPRRSGALVPIQFSPQGQNQYSLTPWPMDEQELTFEIPYRKVPKSATSSLEAFRDAYQKADLMPRIITLTPGEHP